MIQLIKSELGKNEFETALKNTIRKLIDNVNYVTDNFNEEEWDSYNDSIQKLDDLYVKLNPNNVSQTIGMMEYSINNLNNK